MEIIPLSQIIGRENQGCPIQKIEIVESGSVCQRSPSLFFVFKTDWGSSLLFLLSRMEGSFW